MPRCPFCCSAISPELHKSPTISSLPTFYCAVCRDYILEYLPGPEEPNGYEYRDREAFERLTRIEWLIEMIWKKTILQTNVRFSNDPKAVPMCSVRPTRNPQIQMSITFPKHSVVLVRVDAATFKGRLFEEYRVGIGTEHFYIHMRLMLRSRLMFFSSEEIHVSAR